MFSEANTLIETRLGSNWNTTPIQYDNVTYRPTIGTSFVRLQIQWVDAGAVGMGGRARGVGYIDLSIYEANNTGAYAAAVKADALAAIFNRYATAALKCKYAKIQRVGEIEAWYLVKVIIPFSYDACY
jgi:hypothetical protein